MSIVWKENLKKIVPSSVLAVYYNLYPQRPLYSENSFLLSRWVMWLWMRYRMVWFLLLRRFNYSIDLSALIGPNKYVVLHNLWRDAFTSRFSRRRSEHLIYLLKSIPSVKQEGRVLSIGPKNEGEILLLRAHGFKHARGIDLFSYSPLIDVMDMHHTEFAESTFDVIMAGWVVRYSYDIHQFAKEVIRIAKPGAHIAIAFSYRKGDPDGPETGTKLEGGTRELMDYFSGHLDRIYWQMDDDNTDEQDIPSATHSIVFSVRK